MLKKFYKNCKKNCHTATVENVNQALEPKIVVFTCSWFIVGKGKGTPALKNGIKCYKVDTDEDSDTHSDWQGFWFQKKPHTGVTPLYIVCLYLA